MLKGFFIFRRILSDTAVQANEPRKGARRVVPLATRILGRLGSKYSKLSSCEAVICMQMVAVAIAKATWNWVKREV